MNKKESMKICPNCNEQLHRIWFTAQMIEEWTWNGWHWECTARHSLAADPGQSVICPNCETVVGAGFDFGFGIVHK